MDSDLGKAEKGISKSPPNKPMKRKQVIIYKGIVAHTGSIGRLYSGVVLFWSSIVEKLYINKNNHLKAKNSPFYGVIIYICIISIHTS